MRFLSRSGSSSNSKTVKDTSCLEALPVVQPLVQEVSVYIATAVAAIVDGTVDGQASNKVADSSAAQPQQL